MTTPSEQLVDDVQPTLEVVARLIGADVVPMVAALSARAAAVLLDVAADPGGAVDVLHAVWGQGDPEPWWWSTPLGLTVAAALGDDATPVTHQHAADVLGVTRGTVAQLVARGTLARLPEGGVARGSVLTRLCRLRAVRA